MATAPEFIEDDDQDDDVLDLDEADVVVEDDDDGGDEDGDEVETPSFGDDEETTPAETDLVKHLRAQIRDRDKRLSETRRAEPDQPIVVGDKPTMEACEYDEDRFTAEYEAWQGRKSKADRQASERQSVQERQEQEWSKVKDNYATNRAAIRAPDVADAEEAAFSTLSQTAQALIFKHADNPAAFIYAAGKSPVRLAELARVDTAGDPFALMKAVTKMEATLTTKKVSRPRDPVKPVQGRAVSSAGDQTMAKLEAEGGKSGDYSKLVAYRAAQKDKK